MFNSFKGWTADTLKITGSLCMAVIVGTIAVDSRYTHSSDFDQYKGQMNGFLSRHQDDVKKEVRSQRTAHLEDQIFMLSLKIQQAGKHAAPLDHTMLMRYKDQLAALSNETNGPAMSPPISQNSVPATDDQHQVVAASIIPAPQAQSNAPAKGQILVTGIGATASSDECSSSETTAHTK